MPILYVYEVQLEPAVQRKGLGVFLMTLLKLLAKKNQLQAIMLTVMNVSGTATAKSTANQQCFCVRFCRSTGSSMMSCWRAAGKHNCNEDVC